MSPTYLTLIIRPRLPSRYTKIMVGWDEAFTYLFRVVIG
jgi:hypothetical protein